MVGAAALVCAGAVASPDAGGRVPFLSSDSVGGARFGTDQSRAVRELRRSLGEPSRRFVSDGCGPNYTEVEWSHLYVEFRHGRLSGFRYLRGAWVAGGVSPGSALSKLQPMVATSKGITLGSTLRQLRRRYGTLTLVGTDRWRERGGLIFYVSFATTQPPPPSSRITEIKFGTCGDW